MIEVTLKEIAKVVDGQLVGDDASVSDVSTDSRAINDKTLFVALIGEKFDAHSFIPQVAENGAAAVMVQQQQSISLPQIIVNDTKKALGCLAAWVHQQCNTPTVAITGSCGKTTVKEMIASILSRRGEVLFTAGNFNNDIGVPLTLLRSQQTDDYAVIELGANHQGEISYTTSLVKPDIALVNNVAAAHLEGFGSLDGVKKAKGEIYQGLKAGSPAIVNLDSNGGDLWTEVLRDKQVVTFSVNHSEADFYATDIDSDEHAYSTFNMQTPQGTCPVTLNVVGVHNVSNALAASAIALRMGASLDDIQWGLSHLRSVKGRVDAVELTDCIKLIDDSYNASVPAMKAAIDLLGSFSGARWLILGNMAELGEESLALHRQVGEHAAPFKFEHILTYGKDSLAIAEACGGKHFSTHNNMIAYIEQQLDNNNDQKNVLLIKGANSSGMSKIVAALKEKYL